MSNSGIETNLSSIGIRLLVNTAVHPFDYAKFLIQIGHEPIKPFPTKTLLGKPVYGLPSIFKYVNYIYTVDGLAGCYRGILPRLASSALFVFVQAKVSEDFKVLQESDVHEEELNEKEKCNKFVNKVGALVVCKTTAIIVTHPLHVVACRTMAQFVGNEVKYSGILRALWTIYNEEGLSGLFSGLIPRWFGEISCLIIASTATYVFNQYVIQDSDMRTFTTTSIQFLASSLMYPFQVVSSCMTVSGSGLVAGSPPQLPVFTSSFECWTYLGRQNQLKRGSSLFFRYYTPPNKVLPKIN